MKSLCFVSGQGANHRNTHTMQGCGDGLQHRPGAKGASFMCSYLRDDTPGGAAASPRADDRWHNAPCTKALPQPQSPPPTPAPSANRSSRVAEGFPTNSCFPQESAGQRIMSDTASVYQAYQGNTYLF